LSDIEQAYLWQALNSLADDGGLWNGPKVATKMTQLTGKPIHRQRGWEYLRLMNFRQLVPRAQHDEADTLAAARMEKKLNLEQERLRVEYPAADIEVWAMDEHRLGLKPVQRRVWAQQGEQPLAGVKWRFQWLWLYGFVHPESGETYGWILPKVNINLFNRVLADFAQHFGVGKNKRIILALDRAGWHISDQVEIPEAIHLLFLPPYSPELQPAERLWPLINEPIANRSFQSLDELEDVLFYRCQRLLQLQQLIRGLTFFHWWPGSITTCDRTPTLQVRCYRT
jgi:transposase